PGDNFEAPLALAGSRLGGGGAGPPGPLALSVRGFRGQGQRRFLPRRQVRDGRDVENVGGGGFEGKKHRPQIPGRRRPSPFHTPGRGDGNRPGARGTPGPAIQKDDGSRGASGVRGYAERGGSDRRPGR